MSIDQTEVLKIARLARLAIHEQDLPKYAQDLSKILGLVEQMNAADLEGVDPSAHPLQAIQRLREDVVTEPDEHQKYQRLAPKVEAGLYLVPQVIE